MDSRIGLDFIVENPEYIRKLAAALDTNNVTVKKQVFELLSALCVHNEEGHARALDTLEHYKKLKSERYRLNVIVKELDRATAVDYQTALVAFINCLIISTPRLNDRVRRRNEFIGCHLLPVLNNLRKCAEAEPELAVQLDVFDEQRESDDAQSLQGPHGVDLNSPLDVFYAILKQVAETPQEIPFLSILQHLLRIDPKDAVSDIVWDTAERLVHRATLLENREDASKLLRAPSVPQSKFFCHCQSSTNSLNRRQSLTLATPQSPTAGGPPPPPPPPAIGVVPPPPFVPPPCPPQVMSVSVKNRQSDAPPISGGAPTDPAPDHKLPQQEIPAPKIKMKTFNWNKIPDNKVIGKNNVWTQVACTHQDSPMADLDWLEMEGLFCQQAPTSAQNSPKLGGRGGEGGDCRRIRKDNCEITLLDGKRSLNVNIFLKQFRTSNEDIVQLIQDGEHDEIGAEKLKGLLKILPEVDELDMLKSFNGDFTKLGNAEKFLIQLTNLSNYKLRIESMLLKEEFACNMGYLEPSIKSMIMAARDLTTNKPLQEVLYMILVAGNFLNAGGYAGNAAGVKLSSLQKITDIRANKPNMNLIHFVALQAEKRNPKLLTFSDNIGVLEDAAKTTVEQLLNEINALDVKIKKVKKQIDTPTTEPEIKQQMADFLQMAEAEVSNLQRNMGELENVRVRLSEFFCEDVNSFKLEECFRIFHGFYCKFRQAVGDNERRRIQEEQANARRRQREELLATKRRQMESLAGTPDSDAPYIDLQIYDTRPGFPMKKTWKTSSANSEDELSITSSPALSRRRLGSFNNGNANDDKSPDITPNGSLRRRRSRVLSEEDEGNLMDFLRLSSAQHESNQRERKSWGSLDRSWARKARGSGPRKRPALLGADFTSDRERPSSPSPLSENKSILSAPEEGAAATKPWKQKIESWLQANNETTETAKRQSPSNSASSPSANRSATRLTNRRSLEMDSESDRSILDTLPEGKQVYTGGQSNYRKVNPSWQPSTTIDNTDVVKAMETVEEVIQPIKDKSAWRKSTLNVANSTEDTRGDTRRSLHSIDEDNSRKSLISSLGDRGANDKLTLYIIKPGTGSLRDSPPILEDCEDTVSNNKVEIDQDNIETPPAIRKVFIPTPTEKREPVPPSPCKRLMAATSDCGNGGDTGDGHFDRFSAARRTRRYKRSGDNVVENGGDNEQDDQKESRLKQWQYKLKSDNVPLKANGGRRYRNQTGINQDQVKMALLGLDNDGAEEIQEINADSVDNKAPRPTPRIDVPRRHSSGKPKDHDHDEGFEETQSLMSESPSQGASSGGGTYEDTLLLFNATGKKPERVEDSTSSETVAAPSRKHAVTNRKTEGATRKGAPSQKNAQTAATKTSVIPRRSNSLKKTESQSSVQRSGSRNSIASSRTSLNSATSTSTVKKAPTRPSNVIPAANGKGGGLMMRTSSLRGAPSNHNSLMKPALKRSPSNGTKPPRPLGMSFMKPTAASTTKSQPGAVVINNNTRKSIFK